jgi:hypothetical protein
MAASLGVSTVQGSEELVVELVNQRSAFQSL